MDTCSQMHEKLPGSWARWLPCLAAQSTANPPTIVLQWNTDQGRCSSTTSPTWDGKASHSQGVDYGHILRFKSSLHSWKALAAQPKPRRQLGHALLHALHHTTACIQAASSPAMPKPEHMPQATSGCMSLPPLDAWFSCYHYIISQTCYSIVYQAADASQQNAATQSQQTWHEAAQASLKRNMLLPPHSWCGHLA